LVVFLVEDETQDQRTAVKETEQKVPNQQKQKKRKAEDAKKKASTKDAEDDDVLMEGKKRY
jgi:hypothetical protein